MDPLFWIVWVLLTVTVVVWETIAIFNKRRGDTISETTRWVFRIKTSKVGRAVFVFLWMGFCGWFLLHILTGAV